ncbi:DsrE family protein [Nostoc favosum]|uniref:DsrE family protein n=1 Tax=Nostoc favosum CHAB5714 TaxID=2780399 RepID=A0ABS8IH76_9NOSO|nr:DsrE family protein [Nostoc favosum]MCC5603251.1 DsrE family protein [Nostoc favosum CHAB5714]
MLESKSSIFLGVMGAPYESELCTSLLRIVDAAITQGDQVIVWTCGGATTLTQKTLSNVKPYNLLDVAADKKKTEYPSTMALIRELLEVAEGRVQWFVCRHCMEERGAIEQMEEVKVKSPFKFLHYLEQADVSMILGIK